MSQTVTSVAGSKPLRVSSQPNISTTTHFARSKAVPEENNSKILTPAQRHARQINGLGTPAATHHRFRAKLSQPLPWLTLSFFALCALLLWVTYRMYLFEITQMVAQATEKAGHRVEPSVDQFNEALGQCAKFAAISLLIGLIIYFFVDRIHRVGFLLKAVAVTWGGAVAVFLALLINTWVSQLLGEGPEDDSSATKAAIFVAPFVEEWAKGTVLFLLAILMRKRLIGAVQVVTLGGLSAFGFAATENITYYLRSYVSAALVPGKNPNDALFSIFIQRGLLTWWGHPLFTTCTAIGVAIGLRNRSKIVRVVAPAVGYLCAATLHMLFNGSGTFFGDNGGAQLAVMISVGGGLVLSLLIRWAFHLRKEGRMVGARLSDFVREGWLVESDPVVFSRFLKRTKLLVAALLRGPRILRATLRLQRVMLELAYVRAGMTWGIIDSTGHDRVCELLGTIKAERALGLSRTEGLTIKPPSWTLRNIKDKLRSIWNSIRGRDQYSPQDQFPAGTYNGYAPPTAM